MKLKTITFLISCLVFSGKAQYTELALADDYFERGQPQRALNHYKKAYSQVKPNKKKNKLEVKGYTCYRLGKCYAQMSDLPASRTYFEKAIALKYAVVNPTVLFELGAVLKGLGLYEEAQDIFQEYYDLSGNEKGHKALKGCMSASEIADSITRYIVNEEHVLNTKSYDFSPSFWSKKKDVLCFTSNRESGVANLPNYRTGGKNKDLWIVSRDKKGHWTQPKILNSLINTQEDEGVACIDSKGNTMYFTRCERTRDTCRGCDIYRAERRGANWGVPTIVELRLEGETCNTVRHPTISKNGKYLIFSSNMSGGYGGHDLWVSTYDKKQKKWKQPTNLGPDINSESDEVFPFIRDDGELYFASDRYNGLGGLDVYKSVSLSEMKWGAVINMGAPINSSFDDFGIAFEGDSERGYLSSNRNASGKDDLYAFNLPPLIFSLEVYVFDDQLKEPVGNAKVQLIDDQGQIVERVTDENGGVRFEERENGARYILAAKEYTLQVGKKGEYLNTKQQFSTVDVSGSKRFIYEFVLQGKGPIRIPEVRYDFGKSTLQVNDTVNSKDSLDYLYQIMIDNPSIVVQLRSHTDCRGNDMLNTRLSHGRAKSCVDYLVLEKGIEAERLIPTGMGKTEPLKGLSCLEINKLPVEMDREFAHQRNRRTDFKIISWDFVSPD